MYTHTPTHPHTHTPTHTRARARTHTHTVQGAGVVSDHSLRGRFPQVPTLLHRQAAHPLPNHGRVLCVRASLWLLRSIAQISISCLTHTPHSGRRVGSFRRRMLRLSHFRSTASVRVHPRSHTPFRTHTRARACKSTLAGTHTCMFIQIDVSCTPSLRRTPWDISTGSARIETRAE